MELVIAKIILEENEEQDDFLPLEQAKSQTRHFEKHAIWNTIRQSGQRVARGYVLKRFVTPTLKKRKMRNVYPWYGYTSQDNNVEAARIFLDHLIWEIKKRNGEQITAEPTD